MNSSSRARSEVFDANGRVVVGPGNFFLLMQSSAAINVRFVRGGTTFGADNIEAGYVKGLIEPWERCYIDGGIVGTTVRFFAGDEQIAEDFTDYRRTVGVFQQQFSSSLVAPAADIAVGAGATSLSAANAGRRKVTVKLLITADTNIRLGPTATITATRGLQLEPGQSYTYEGTADLFGIREGGTTAPVSVLEEFY